MSDLDRVARLLTEIRDNQQKMIENQERHLSIASEQLERARRQVEESIGLQREAIARTRSIARIAFPGILVCIAAIVYLVLRYF